MNILLDTHIALWAVAETKKLPEKCIELFQVEDNNFYVSIASVWEVAIKNILRPDKVVMSDFEYVNLCEMSGFNMLPLRVGHIFTLKTLKRLKDAPEHKDPFDRIMIAQAKFEKFYFLTHDKLLPYYGEDCIIKV